MKDGRRPLFSIKKSEYDVQSFRSGGPGGQHQNKSNTGIRIVHRASGARGEARERRSQLQNKRLAFRRLIDSPEFQLWVKMEAQI